MARVFITGSSDGLGKMAAQLLIEQGHKVVLHARNEERGAQARAAVRGAEAVVLGDLSSIQQTREVAEQVNALGNFDAVIHNAAVGYREPRRVATEDGLPQVFAVNTLAPYILDSADSEAETIGLPELRTPSGGRFQPEGSDVGAAIVAGTTGIFRYQIPRCFAGVRRGATVAGCFVERCGTGMGGNQDGRTGCVG